MADPAWITGDWDGKLSPYVHWQKHLDTLRNDPLSAPLSPHITPPGMASMLTASDAELGEYSDVSDALGDLFGSEIGSALPPEAINRGFDPNASWLPDLSGFDDALIPPSDAVITGVIDSAIALGHARFLQKSGQSTRFLAAWQQSAPCPSATTSNLPFGRELLAPDINDLLATHSQNDVLDEEAFNHAAGLVDLAATRGQRELNYDVAHGTHVADLASGFDIASEDVTEAQLQKRPLIAVGLPNRFGIGSSGNYLEYYVIHAIERIIDLADALWKRGYEAEHDPAKAKGFAIVINLSYGLQAGPKDGTMALEQYLSAKVHERLANGWSPLRLVLPAGNTNLEKGNALARISSDHLAQQGNEFQLDWRLVPEDQTANFLEVWSGDLDGPLTSPPLQIALIAPDGQQTALSAGPHGHYLDLSRYARIYARVVRKTIDGPGGTQTVVFRHTYTICAAPTLEYTPGAAIAPSGRWHVDVKVIGAEYAAGLDVYFHVQSDQSITPGLTNGRLSYLDSEAYQAFDDSALSRDTYTFSDETLTPDQADLEPLNRFGPLQRKGALNAIATMTDAIVIAGFQESDGRPADYSGTGFAPPDRAGGRAAPTASFCTDDGPAHQGVLAAGSRSGATVVMQGTSFASATATRYVAEALFSWAGETDWRDYPGGPEHIFELAGVADVARPNRRYVFDTKSGGGRISTAPIRYPRRDSP